MTKKRQKFKSVRRHVEDRKALKELKQLQRDPGSFQTDPITGVSLPKGHENMSKDRVTVLLKRRAKINHYNRTKKDPNLINAIMMFTPGELLIPPPSEDEIKTMEAVNPKMAKVYKHYKPHRHMIPVPIQIRREDGVPMKTLWKKHRNLLKADVIRQRAEIEEQMKQNANVHEHGHVDYDPAGPTILNLNELTTAQETNDAEE